MSGAIPPLLQYASMTWCLVKRRDSFTFTINIVMFSKIKLKVMMLRYSNYLKQIK